MAVTAPRWPSSSEDARPSPLERSRTSQRATVPYMEPAPTTKASLGLQLTVDTSPYFHRRTVVGAPGDAASHMHTQGAGGALSPRDTGGGSPANESRRAVT